MVTALAVGECDLVGTRIVVELPWRNEGDAMGAPGAEGYVHCEAP